MQRIQQLPTQVVDQIAAGEMLERPAHLVKELVENALDAGSTDIQIDLRQGGRWVRVTDNGSGIPADELPLALNRFATSKIRTAEDLWNLHSFGFRGEALAAAGAVSRLTLTSRPSSQEWGAQIKNNFGIIDTAERVAFSAGTQITIEDLFQNLPAREKFLKKEGPETVQIKRTLKGLAASRPDVSFTLRVNNELSLYFPVSLDPSARIANVLGVDHVYGCQGRSGDYSAEIFFAPPTEVSGSSQSIWIFVQSRWVQDRTVQAAVMEAHRNLLMHHEFPYLCAFINGAPGSIDANVHPTKSQVRYRDPSAVFRLVQSTLRDALSKVAGPGSQPSSSLVLDRSAPTEAPVQEQISLGSDSSSILSASPPVAVVPPASDLSRTQSRTKFLAEDQPALFNNRSATIDTPRKAESTNENSIQTSARSSTEKSTEVKPFWSKLEVLGQAGMTYILAQSDRAFYMIDQHAAHERVRFERIMKLWNDRSREVERQDLLLPHTVIVGAVAVDHFERHRERLLEWGFDIEPFGQESVVVRSHPTLIDKKSLQPLLEKMANAWGEDGTGDALEDRLSELASTAACHSSVRAGQALSLTECRALLDQMDEFPFSSFCPHGRPVYIETPFSQIEKDFGRRL